MKVCARFRPVFGPPWIVISCRTHIRRFCRAVQSGSLRSAKRKTYVVASLRDKAGEPSEMALADADRHDDGEARKDEKENHIGSSAMQMLVGRNYDQDGFGHDPPWYARRRQDVAGHDACFFLVPCRGLVQYEQSEG